MELFREHIYQLGKQKFVSDIVNKILEKDKMDYHSIKKVELDDNGNCIHVTFAGAVSASTFNAIAEAFGDCDPSVFAEGENLFKVVFTNDKYEDLID